MKAQPGTAWITQAYKGWLEALDQATGFTQGLDTAGVTHVILLGLAQHGKTSLALRLLEATAFEAIGEALRGGRHQGQSATPGPIGYYACPASKGVDLGALKDKVEGIFNAYAASCGVPSGRDRSGPAPFHALPEVPIPSAHPEGRFKLVDMAGFDGREFWAEAAAAYWTARADFTILVIQAEKIYQLTGEDFKSVIHQFKNRWTHSDSMLVVTTCSFEQKEDPAEKGLSWESISQLRRDTFHRDVLGDSSIPREKVEFYPMSLRPGPEEELDAHTRESLARLRRRLSEPSLLTKLSNVRILHQDRVASLQAQRAAIEKDQAKAEAQRAAVEAALVDLDLARQDCAAVKDRLQTHDGRAYTLRPFTEVPRHDLYKIQEPLNAFTFHATQLGRIQDATIAAMYGLQEQWRRLLSLECSAPLVKDLAAYLMTQDLKKPIPDEAFKVRHYLGIKYNEDQSGLNLQRAMERAEREICREAIRCSVRLKDDCIRNLARFSDDLDLAETEKRKDQAEVENLQQQLLERLADLEARQEALPPIPDLEARLVATFAQAWNETTERANRDPSNSSAIAQAFLEHWAMKEALGQVETRFSSLAPTSDPAVES